MKILSVSVVANWVFPETGVNISITASSSALRLPATFGIAITIEVSHFLLLFVVIIIATNPL